MVESINSAWMTAAKSNPVRPVYIVTLRFGSGTVDGTDQYTIASRHGFGYGASLSDVGAIGVALDIQTRTVTFSTFQLSVRRDPLIRQLVSVNALKGKQAVIKMGFVGLALSNFITLATTRILDAVPDETGVQIKCGPVGLILNDNRGKFQFTNEHPLEALQIILANSSVSTALYDATTLDPDNFPEISHWNLSRQERTGTQGHDPYGLFELEATSARDLIGSLLNLLDGTFTPNTSGVHRFRRYDYSAAAARTWGRQQILEFKPLQLWEQLRNEVIGRFGRGSDYQYTAVFEDAISKAFHVYPGESEHTESEPFETDWLNAIGTLIEGDPVPAGEVTHFFDISTSFEVVFAGQNGFSGARYNPNTLTIDASAELGSGRYAYLMITGRDKRIDALGGGFVNDKPEIVKIASIDIETVPGDPPGIVGPDGNSYPRHLRFTLDTGATNGGRAQFETSPFVPLVWRGGAIVTDVTMLVDRALRILRRQAYGVRMIEVRTNIREMEIEVGDFVALDDDTYLDFGFDGNTDGIVWEVISKEVRALDDSPGIVWQLAFVRADAVPVNTPTWVQPESGYTPVGPTGCPLYAHDGTAILTSAGDLVYARNC